MFRLIFAFTGVLFLTPSAEAHIPKYLCKWECPPFSFDVDWYSGYRNSKPCTCISYPAKCSVIAGATPALSVPDLNRHPLRLSRKEVTHAI